MTIWAAISWYSPGPIITQNVRITASDYVDILGSQVHPVVQMLFPSSDVFFQNDISPIHMAESVHSWLKSMKRHFNISPGQQNSQT